MLTQEKINRIISEIESESNIKRKRHAWSSELIRTGELKSFVERRIIQMYPKTHQMYTITDYSVLKKIVDKKSKSYKEHPIRKINGAEASTEIYTEICNKYDLDSAMQAFDVIYNQDKYALMACFMDRLPDGANSKYMFKFFALAPYEFDVVMSDSGELEMVILSYPSKSVKREMGDSLDLKIAESGNSDEDTDERHYSFWTKEEHLMVKVSGHGEHKSAVPYLNEGMTGLNPYGVLPFSYAPRDRSSNYPNRSPLPSQTVEFNALMSVYLTSANMQVGVLKITRPSKQKITLSSHSLYTAIEVPQSEKPEDPKADISFISPTPNMAGHKEAIITYLQTIVDEQGIKSTDVINPNQEFTSGFDRLLSMADVQQIIEENQMMYHKVEKDIYNIVKTQLQSVGQNVLPDEGFNIIYRKPTIMLSDREKLENLKSMKDLGLWSDWELIQMYDPNLSEDESKNKLINIQTEKANLASSFTDPSKVFNGAQVSAIVDVATKVGIGQISYESGVSILVTSFGIPEEIAQGMIPQEGTVDPNVVI